MTMSENPTPADQPAEPQMPVVREGEYQGASYRIETYHAPEEL